MTDGNSLGNPAKVMGFGFKLHFTGIGVGRGGLRWCSWLYGLHLRHFSLGPNETNTKQDCRKRKQCLFHGADRFVDKFTIKSNPKITDQKFHILSINFNAKEDCLPKGMATSAKMALQQAGLDIRAYFLHLRGILAGLSYAT